MRGWILFLMVTAWAAHGVAQDVDTQYLRLQEAYTQRLQDLEGRHQRQQRELLNKFILALVRTEQSYREEGNLEGVVASRELRETLLQQPEFPVPDESAPETILEMTRELQRRQLENQAASQAELDELNQVLLRTLEPYKVEFTRQGNLERALEIRDLQVRLTDSLDEAGSLSEPDPAPVAAAASNPNAYGFLFEADVFQTLAGFPQRAAMVAGAPELGRKAVIEPKGLRIRGSYARVDAPRMEPLRETCARSQMFTLEFSLTARYSHQGTRESPRIVFLWGEEVPEANLAIVQEGNRLFLHLKTSGMPAGMPTHRLDLGVIDDIDPHHITVVYRANEVTVFRNGIATERLRGSIRGSLSAWEESDAVFGRIPPEAGEPDTSAWAGQLHQLSIKAGLDTQSKITDNFRRFETALDL